VTVRGRLDGPQHFRLEVEDTGIGIHAQDLGRLFVEFQQLDTSAGKRYEGTGLGLALTKRLVEAHGGHVGVRSTPGVGSLFFAVLPRVLADTSVATAPVEATPVAGAAWILVIEDDPSDQAWLARALRGAGYAVAVAATGAEAVARCREQVFDAVTLDLILPDMSAADVIKAIRAEGRRRDVAVVAVTVVAEERATRSLDVTDVLIKPVDPADLLDALHRAGAPPPDRSATAGSPGIPPVGG
jgi:CheY-like chemotaxis protein